MAERQVARENRQGGSGQKDDGFMLLAAIVMVFLVLLALSVAAPKIATELKREREVEAVHRANQYVRAIRVYQRKFKNYPTSVEMLVKSNNQRFLRQKYLDPLTGKDDWRLIHVGENKTKVKGFFGEDLPTIGSGLGSGIGAPQTTGSSSGGTTSAFNSPQGSNSSTGTAAGGSTTGGTGVQSTDATAFTGSSGGGPIMGIGSSKSGDAIVVVNEQTTYDTWEFLYDPAIEQLYAKASLIGGLNSGGSSTGLNGLSSPTAPGAPIVLPPPTPAPNQ